MENFSFRLLLRFFLEQLMDLIKRGIQDSVDGQTPPKAVLIFGARRIGKTTLLEQIVDRNTSAWYTGDSYSDIERLKLLSEGDVKTLLFQSDTLIIDEAQRIPDIGLLLKRLVDMNMTLDSPVRIFVTGSSSLELAKGIKESAVGRLVQRQMWPLSVTELAQAPKSSWAKVLRDLDWHLVYGMFPEVYNEPQKARILLKDYVDGILFKDLFSLGGIRLNSKFEVLVRLLAYSVGSEVSYDSLARETGLNKTTVADYITLLEQCFIVKVCPSYAKNLANELKKGKKVYFCDNGIRNAIIENFDPLPSRHDRGALWENFFFMERVKLHSLLQDFCRIYFWRTSGKKTNELDFIEVIDGKMQAFECKLSPKAEAKPGPDFEAAYPDCPINVVSPATMLKVWLEVENVSEPM